MHVCFESMKYVFYLCNRFNCVARWWLKAWYLDTRGFIPKKIQWHIHTGSWSLVNYWREAFARHYIRCSWILMRVAVSLTDGLGLDGDRCIRVIPRQTALITARKWSFGQGNIFSSMCQEFCSWGRVVSQHALQVISQHALQCGGVEFQHALQVVSQHALQVSRPTPRGEVEGSGQGVSRPTPRGVSRPTPRRSLGPHPGGSPGPHPEECVYPGPHLGGVSQHALRQTSSPRGWLLPHPTGMHSC